MPETCRWRPLQCGFRALQSTPEGNEGIGTFAVAYENDSAGIQIQNDGQIVMPSANGYLIDGQPFEMFQFGMGEAFLQIPFLNILDHVPSDVEMTGYVLDGHVPAKLQGVAFECPCIGVARIGTGGTPHSLDSQNDPYRLATDGKATETPFLRSR
jgi:hypothetical protein